MPYYTNLHNYIKEDPSEWPGKYKLTNKAMGAVSALACF